MHDSIYPPSEDSFLLLEAVKTYSGSKALDVGTGTGIIAEELAKNFKIVKAIDLNDKAIKYCKNKIRNIEFLESNLFQNIKEKFDLITFNPPYLPQDENLIDNALYGGKKGNETIIAFLKQAKIHLKTQGIILLLFSSYSKPKEILKFLRDNFYDYKLKKSLKLDFEELYVYEIKNKIILGKGKRGIVYKTKYKNKNIAVKIKNELSKTNTLEFEANTLKKINNFNIGPKFYFFKNNMLGMELIKGINIEEFFEKETKENILLILKKIFSKLRILDKQNINKSEMNHPQKHIIIKDLNPVLIDFERAKFMFQPQNITQFCQYLTSFHIKKILEGKNIRFRFNNLLQNYKMNQNEKNFKKIIDILK